MKRMKRSVEFREPEQVVINDTLGKVQVTGKIASVRNGTCHSGLPASLVVLEFGLFGKQPPSKSRILKATVKIDCMAIDNKNTNSSSLATQPEVEHFCPGILNGHVTEREMTSEITWIGGVMASPVHLSAHHSKLYGWSEEHYSTVEGQKSQSTPSSRRSQAGREHDSVEWTLQEDQSLLNGILPRFKVALLLKHAGSKSQFELNIALSVSVNFNKFLDVPWTSSLTPLSVIFRPMQPDETQEMPDFDEYSNEHWKHLVNYDEVYTRFKPLELVG